MLGANGRVKGSYVYMMVCHDGGSIYIKVGRSCLPMRRLDELRHGCPITPRYFYTVNVYSREESKRIEGELHFAYAEWRINGEWFKLNPADKQAFNAAWRKVFSHFAKPSWPLSWVRMSIAPIAAAARSRGAFALKVKRGHGRAYEDFLHQSQK